MKTFDNIQELWDYCSYCPICQKDSRKIDVSVGPDAVFRLCSFQKDENLLTMNCRYTNKTNVFAVDYCIGCQNNTFDVSVIEVAGKSDENWSNAKVLRGYFYFWIQSQCYDCMGAYSYSNDLELDMLNKKVFNIGLERESFFLLKTDDKIEVRLYHDQDFMAVSKYKTGHQIKMPIMDLDFSDQAKVIERIKTLTMFI